MHQFPYLQKPDTFDLAKPADIMGFVQYHGQSEKTVIFPKGYVPQTTKVFEKSPFKGHGLKANGLTPVEKVPGEGWVFVALVGVFVLLLWTRRLNPKKLWVYLSAVYNRRSQNELFDEENLLTSPFSLLLFFTFCLTGALFITKTIDIFTSGVYNDFINLQAFAIIAGALLSVYAAKIILIQLIGFIFHIYPIARQYAFNVYLLNNILGMILIPLVAIAYYTGSPADMWALYVGLSLFSLFFVLRCLKAFTIEGVATPLNLLYLFLYLCTLEILPLIVVIKVVTSYV